MKRIHMSLELKLDPDITPLNKLGRLPKVMNPSADFRPSLARILKSTCSSN